MTLFTVQLFNFILLLFLIYLFFMPTIESFFYGRKMRIRKEMASAAWKLRKARANLKSKRLLEDGLEIEVDGIRNEIEMSGKRECGEIMQRARVQRQGMLEYVKGQIDQDEKKSQKAVERQLLERAFLKAGDRLSCELSSEAKRGILKKGLEGIGDRFTA